MLHIGYVLAETVIFCVFNGQDTEQFPLQFGNQILIFDDVVLVVASDMDSIYVFIRDGYGIADKENGLGGSMPDVIVTGTDIPFGKVQVKIKTLLPCVITVVQLPIGIPQYSPSCSLDLTRQTMGAVLGVVPCAAVIFYHLCKISGCII